MYRALLIVPPIVSGATPTLEAGSLDERASPTLFLGERARKTRDRFARVHLPSDGRPARFASSFVARIRPRPFT